MVLALLLWASAAHATIFTVTNTSDADPGSLRAAINAANDARGNNTIVFEATGTITLGDMQRKGMTMLESPAGNASGAGGSASRG